MNSQRLPKLTTTSFALLGLLQRRSWSAYELTRYMRSSILRAVWPRAESHLYSEPKSLEKRGYVVSHQELNGARKRTVYSITETGSSALRDWLKEVQSSEFHFEYELLVRFALADTATDEAVQLYLQQMREDALRDAREALASVEQMRADTAWLKTSTHASYSGAMIHLVIDQLEMRLQWAQLMSARFSSIQDTAEATALGLDLYAEAEQRLHGLLKAN